MLPQHALSRVTGWLAECRIPWLKNWLIRLFVRRYGVNLAEAEQTRPEDYPHFNAFFTRALKTGARPLATDASDLLAPVDGTISQIGRIDHGRLLQAKGQSYALTSLLGGDPSWARLFEDGHFATLYLAPADYHRVHMPIAGQLQEMVYVPGSLFSVNDSTTRQVPDLFTRNERLVVLLDTPAGPLAMVLVGAMIVAGIETSWSGRVVPPARGLRHWSWRPQNPEPPELAPGEEMGRFCLGSTVILLFGPNSVRWLEACQSGTRVRMGSTLGRVLNKAAECQTEASPSRSPRAGDTDRPGKSHEPGRD